jgi:hypothetical protein
MVEQGSAANRLLGLRFRNPPGGGDTDVCVVCCTVRTKSKSQANPDKETSTDEVHSENKKQIPVGSMFSAPILTGPGVQPLSYRVRTGFFFSGVKRPGRGVNHPPLSSDEVKETIELCHCPVCRPSWRAEGRNVRFHQECTSPC